MGDPRVGKVSLSMINDDVRTRDWDVLVTGQPIRLLTEPQIARIKAGLSALDWDGRSKQRPRGDAA
jgi:hypothetical protein